MITFEHTRNMEAVERILTNPRCYCRMANDAAPKVEDFRIRNRNFTPVLAWEDGAPVAAFLLFPGAGPATAEVHFCFVPATWGRTKEIARAFVTWCWRETSVDRLEGPVPSYNRLALELARAAGFRQYGVQPGAGTKHGLVFDRILMEALRDAA